MNELDDSLIGKSSIKIRFLIIWLYLVNSDKIISKTLINPNPLTFKLASAIIVIWRDGLIHERLLIDFSQLILLYSLPPGIGPVLVILGPTNQGNSIGLPILPGDRIIPFAYINSMMIATIDSIDGIPSCIAI